MNITITTVGSHILVASPYSAEFVSQARRLGGKFQGDTKQWQFQLADLDSVREALMATYGDDGMGAVETVTVQVPVTGCDGKGNNEFRVAGRVVACRRSRDAVVTLAEGVRIISGEFPSSAGSMRAPSIGECDVILQVRGVPADIARRDGMKIVEEQVSAEATRQQLLDEREQLLARLAAVDALLAAS